MPLPVAAVTASDPRRRKTRIGGTTLKRLTGLLTSVAFVVATTGLVAAQMPAAEKKADVPAATKPAPAADKKMPVKTANGTVKTAAADSLVVAGKDKGKDVEWTFVVNGKTQIKKGGKDVMAKDLVPGDGVNVRYMDHDGKSVASAVNARPKPAVAKDATTPAATTPAAKPADKK
jgi:hypothetical protein